MLEVRNVSKNYGKQAVLKKVNLSFESGIYGLLGVNGAGKTTLLNILTDISLPDSGGVYFNGKNISHRKSNYCEYIGFMPQYATFYPEFTAREFLKYMCVIKGIPLKEQKKRVDDLLEEVNLANVADKKLKTYSGGMRQRVGIVQALLNQPKVLILDEPTAGLDPVERIRFRNLISNIAAGRIVILATHIVQDIECIANQVIILHQGEILAKGSPKDIINDLECKVYVMPVDSKQIKQYSERYIISNSYNEGDCCNLRILAGNSVLTEAERVSPNLEDAFLFYTQRSNVIDSVN